MDGGLVITAAGMVSSLGLHLSTSCAAARAGIRRFARLDHYPVSSPEDGSVDGVGACAAPLLTEGFEGDQRMICLASGALKDLRLACTGVSLKGLQSGFYLSIPSANRCHTGKTLSPSIEDSKSSDQEPKGRDSAQNKARALRILREAARLGAWPGVVDLCSLTTSGDTGVAEVLLRAVEDVCSGRIDVAIVGAVDSLLDEDTLAWLESIGRLKTPSMPAGLEPGEAAVFFLLETRANATRRQANALCEVTAIKSGTEKRSLLEGQRSTGEGLAATIEHLLAEVKSIQVEPTWFILDQNGEAYRAIEWGCAELRLLSRGFELDGIETWYPVGSFGSTGAASGAVSICVALEAFRRRYSPASSVIVISSGDGVERAALLLRALLR